MFRRADEIQIFAFDLIHHGVHFGKAHYTLHHAAMHHERGNDIGEALFDHKIPGICQNGFMQAGNIPKQVIEPIARHTAGAVQVDTAKAFHDLGMIGDFKIRHNRLTKTLYLHILAVVAADGYTGVQHIGDDKHPLAYFLRKLRLTHLQLFQAVRLLGDLLFHSFRFVLFALCHQRTNAFGQLIALCAQPIALGNGCAVFGIQRDHFIHQQQLAVLKFLFDIFLYKFGVFPYKFDIQHYRFRSSSYFPKRFANALSCSSE